MGNGVWIKTLLQDFLPGSLVVFRVNGVGEQKFRATFRGVDFNRKWVMVGTIHSFIFLGCSVGRSRPPFSWPSEKAYRDDTRTAGLRDRFLTTEARDAR